MPGCAPAPSISTRWLCGKHIDPYLGGVPLGRLTTPMIREWRAKLLRGGVSVYMTAKAYRLLRSILTTAVEEDKILPRNPCRIRGAGTEQTPERPVLTVAQVFELAELVGRRPVGNIRQLPDGGYRLRYRRHGVRCAPHLRSTHQVRPPSGSVGHGHDGRADYDHDRRYRALVLLATFASLRWGEATALRRCDLDLAAGTVRVRAAYAERSTGELVLGPPKSRAGRRIVGIPSSIVPDLREHLVALRRPGARRAHLPRRQGRPAAAQQLQQIAAWPHAVARDRRTRACTSTISGTPGTHFAAASGASLKDLMARMGHDSERAAIIYQHEARGADPAITSAIDAHVRRPASPGRRRRRRPAGALSPAG